MNIFIHLGSTGSSLILSPSFEKSAVRVIVCRNIQANEVMLMLFQEQVGSVI